MKTVAIVLPTYNEAPNLPPLVTKIMNISRNFKIIVVDDNSNDGTGDIAYNLSKKYRGRVFIINRPKKLGLGSAYIAGFKKAFEINADLIFSMDADQSHDPKYLKELIKTIDEGYDVVIGSRYIKGGGTNWSLWRKIISGGANMLSKHLLNIPINDFTSGYRCYKKVVLEKINLDLIKSSGYSFQDEIIYRCWKAGFKIGEVPIFFNDRTQGKSKLGKKEILKYFLTLVRLKSNL